MKDNTSVTIMNVGVWAAGCGAIAYACKVTRSAKPLFAMLMLPKFKITTGSTEAAIANGIAKGISRVLVDEAKKDEEPPVETVDLKNGTKITQFPQDNDEDAYKEELPYGNDDSFLN